MGPERRFALLIGNSEYTDNVLKQLIAPGKDAQSLADILHDPEIGGYEVQLLLNEPDYKIKEQIQVFFQNRKREDILLLYFSCHGIKDKDSKLYFAAKNTKSNLLAATAVSSEFIHEMMRESRSRRQLLIFDCCNSGAFVKGFSSKSDLRMDTISNFGGNGRII